MCGTTRGEAMDTITSARGKGRPRTFDRDQALRRALEVFWTRGYGAATVAELCAAMGINPPSLYAAFGNKDSLFLEALRHYEATYWAAPWTALQDEPDLRRGMTRFLSEAAAILSSRDGPCGCLVVHSSGSVSTESDEVREALRTLREASRAGFRARLDRARAEGDLPPDVDTEALAGAFAAILQGLSAQARDGASREQLDRIAGASLAMLE
jgi:TetR/AcrR family transcriptional regulator, copper-responsive repressor